MQRLNAPPFYNKMRWRIKLGGHKRVTKIENK